jgi:hypothetical protein
MSKIICPNATALLTAVRDLQRLKKWTVVEIFTKWSSSKIKAICPVILRTKWLKEALLHQHYSLSDKTWSTSGYSSCIFFFKHFGNDADVSSTMGNTTFILDFDKLFQEVKHVLRHSRTVASDFVENWEHAAAWKYTSTAKRITRVQIPSLECHKTPPKYATELQTHGLRESNCMEHRWRLWIKFDICGEFVPRRKIYSRVKGIIEIASRGAHLAPFNILFM